VSSAPEYIGVATDMSRTERQAPATCPGTGTAVWAAARSPLRVRQQGGLRAAGISRTRSRHLQEECLNLFQCQTLSLRYKAVNKPNLHEFKYICIMHVFIVCRGAGGMWNGVRLLRLQG
jgi:hypothetical protein